MARRRRPTRNLNHQSRNLRLVPQLEPTSTLRQLLDEDSPLADAARDLSLCAGGINNLEALEIEPIPSEPFTWSKVPIDQQPIVVNILTALDVAGLQRFGPETQTVVYRLIQLAAGSASAPLLRPEPPARLAAALTWIVLAGNQQFSLRYGQTPSQLWPHFEVNDCTELAQSIAHGLGMWADTVPSVSGARHNTVFLGTPELLFSIYRRALIGIRDEITEIFECELEERHAVRGSKVRVGVAGQRVSGISEEPAVWSSRL